ncbi:MAG: class I SAM-dependent methyltransferase [Myxococcota bacterium]
MTTDTLFWDNIAERYAKRPVPNPDSYQQKLAITKARLHPADIVLDVGCGTGSLALELAPRVAEVHALDVSSAMIEIGRRKAQRRDVTNIRFHQGTLDDTSFKPAQFDAVCAYNILHLLEDRPAALARIFDALKPGGTFVSSTPCIGDSWLPYRPLLATMRWFGKAPWVGIIDTPTHLGELGSAGFVNVQTPDVNASRGVVFIVASKP